MNSGGFISLYAFNQEIGLREFSYLNERATDRHLDYFKSYLDNLKCDWVVEERGYIDRDYHEEYAAFYGTLPNPPSPHCTRLHFFSKLEGVASIEDIARLAADEPSVLSKSYLGFSVVRPEGVAPFGRTVLKAFEKEGEGYERVLSATYEFNVNLLGAKLTVKGLPWQEQDGGVAACASVALWSTIVGVGKKEPIGHYSTTALSELSTSLSLPNGKAYPNGLTPAQICQAIQLVGLHPLLIGNGGKAGDSKQCAFKTESFKDFVALMLRSGLPLMLAVGVGKRDDGDADHVVAISGFQLENFNPDSDVNALPRLSSQVPVVYVNDDNLGPNARHEIEDRQDEEPEVKFATLRPKRRGDPRPEGDLDGKLLFPKLIIAALPQKLRMDPGEMLKRSKKKRVRARTTGFYREGFTLNTIPSGLRFCSDEELPARMAQRV